MYLRHVYRLAHADAPSANLALTAYLDGQAAGPDGIDASAFTVVDEAQTQAENAGWTGDIRTGEGIGSGPFVTLAPGRLISGGSGILILYWTASETGVTYVVSAIPLPYLGPAEADKPVPEPTLAQPLYGDVAEFLRALLPLLDGPRVPNLHDIHALLDGNFPADELVEQLRVREDDVQMGVLDWDDFCLDARSLIEKRDSG